MTTAQHESTTMSPADHATTSDSSSTDVETLPTPPSHELPSSTEMHQISPDDSLLLQSLREELERERAKRQEVESHLAIVSKEAESLKAKAAADEEKRKIYDKYGKPGLEAYERGQDPAAAGFGFGDAVIVELLQDRNLLPQDLETNTGIDTVVAAMSPDLYAPALQVARSLRQAGQAVDIVLEPKKKLKWVFKHANRNGAQYCVVVGADEYAKGEVAIKNLNLGEQESVPMDQLANWVADQQQDQ